MKLQTSITPRRNGTVTALGQDRQTYVFAANATGELECDVADEATIVALLKTDNFYPAPEDAQAALDLLNRLAPIEPETELEVDLGEPGNKPDAALELDDDEPADPNAMPIEGAGATPAAEASQLLLGSDNFDPEVEIGGKMVQLGLVVAAAHAKSGLTVQEWNALPQDQRDDLIDDAADDMEAEAMAAAGAAQPQEAGTPPQAAPDQAAKHNAAVQASAKRGGKKR